MTDVQRVVEQIELVVGLSDGLVADGEFESAARSAREARSRLGHLGSTLVVALLGGTGVGKSSLLNAIAGQRVSSTGLLRPQTSAPLAWVPEDPEPSLRELLDRMGVADVVEQSTLPGVAVIDMVDIDSVVGEHRRLVESALPLVDVAVWVVDPVKYADAALHREFLARDAPGPDQRIFVMNRIDLVPPDRQGQPASRFAAMLASNGVEGPVLETAADPPRGTPIGIDALVDRLRRSLDEKAIRVGRVLDDAAGIAARVARAAGVERSPRTGFDDAWQRWTGSARAAAAAGIGPASREQLLFDLEGLVIDVSVASGPALGRAVRRRFGPELVEAVFDDALARVTGIGGRFDGDRLVTSVAAGLAGPLRETLWPRAALVGALAEVTVSVAEARGRLRRTASAL